MSVQEMLHLSVAYSLDHLVLAADEKQQDVDMDVETETMTVTTAYTRAEALNLMTQEVTPVDMERPCTICIETLSAGQHISTCNMCRCDPRTFCHRECLVRQIMINKKCPMCSDVL